ncbi:MAG TPA: MGMT family protein [Marmoricola sp.]|nr:MGMT family protein [Marmoricola sp.]
MGRVDEDYVEAVLSLVERIPSGRVTTYGALAEVVASHLARGGPRQVGAVMTMYGGAVTWWRVVNASGALPPRHYAEANLQYLREGTPRRPNGAVDLRVAMWWPDRAPTDLGGPS